MKRTKYYKGTLLLILAAILVFVTSTGVSSAEEMENLFTENKIENIEEHINKTIKAGKIPGISVVIVNGEKTVYKKGYGYANIARKEPVTENTLFEIGSTSKAFTGLGILYLEKKGLVNLNDPVSKYIPWFSTKYKGKYVDVTVGQCLYHTSGIPFKTIGYIQEDSDYKALENCVRTLKEQELENYPGESFLYASINYDVLGLIIQNVTGDTYENFLSKNILLPLELNETLLDRHQAYQKENMATGYKAGFLSIHEYYAPTYKGNTPAGYFIMNSKDMERWLKIQMLSTNYPDIFLDLIRKSHIPDRTVSPESGGASYAAGWEVLQKGSGEITHSGSNPNFSSHIVIRPEDRVGVVVLANLNSEYTGKIAQGIMDIIMDRKIKISGSDMMISLDNIGFTVSSICALMTILTIVFLFLFILDMFKRRRKTIELKPANYMSIFFSFCFIIALAYCLYIVPRVFYNGLDWKFVSVWAPYSFIPCVISIFITAVTFLIYFQLTYFFPKERDKQFFPLIVLSFISGFGNAFIIFVINEALNRKNAFESGLLIYFFLGIVLYVFGQKLIRKEMITLVNNIIYSKRIELIEKTLRIPYYEFEKIESGKIHAGLNNDTETISQLPEVIIGILTGAATLLCCFVYLGTINVYGLMMSIVIIFIAAGLYFIIGKSANKLWERTRDIQNVFFQFINDLVQGFKELSLKSKKRKDFRDDMEKCCNEYMEKSIVASNKFVNVFVIGELLFTFVVGTVAFVFPMVFDDIHNNSLRAYIFVFLYMTNPVHSVLDNIPTIFRINVSWKRINELIEKLPQDTEVANKMDRYSNHIQDTLGSEGFNIKLDNVEYKYCNNDNSFIVGPINLKFESGEVTFITGGNGSGKTTLAKLLTGLYKPSSGSISIRNKEMGCRDLGECYSAVFSDYYLFNKLYGIDYEKKSEETNKFLKMLQIDKKLGVRDGEFSTLQLSSGQRKRIALLVSYLEDREIFLFDEWAADQDPQFKKYFYEYLLPELRSRNKCVVAITHDDQYFYTADKIVKLNMGEVNEVKKIKKQNIGGNYVTEIV